MKRLISLFILSSMLLSISSCSGSVEDEDTSSADSSSSYVETTDNRLSDELEDKSFGGAEFPILTTSWYNAADYIYAETQNGDVMNDAIYSSITYVEERFDVDITVAADQNFDAVASTIHKLVMAGDNTYKLFYNHDLKTVSNALSGDFLDIRSLPCVNFSKPWWNGTSESFTIGGKLYFTGNCLALSGIFMNYVLAVNKELAENYKIDTPYDSVVDGDWYLDDLIGLIKDFPNDLDGNGTIDDGDLHGFVTSYYGHLGMQSDLVGTVITKDKDGMLSFVDSTERIVGITEKVSQLLSHGTDKYGATNDYGVDLFKENKAIFMFCEMRNLYTQVRETDIVYGILPFPKYDETQKEYRSSGCDIYWAVPLTASDDAEMIGTVVEALSCKNYNDVVPKIWELVLGRKLADSEEDTAMFNVIRDVQYVDIGYAFSGVSSKLTDLVFLTNNCDSDNVVSYIESRRESVTETINDINQTITNLS